MDRVEVYFGRADRDLSTAYRSLAGSHTRTFTSRARGSERLSILFGDSGAALTPADERLGGNLWELTVVNRDLMLGKDFSGGYE